ncbi:MAG: hypothetical protein COY66_06605 [Candidatus Kerfeldbacteria bacterium CG_4_10_14_0_8_um_filter_42_10]|uniref:Glycosyltransferase 2-like domain-containing protein n=1 Tax=Candidatus Kerfeldbacteria bacterium CG_4_10_14_0_8_um_filter_42_10 TaxID=2014248 RepID=A0A2M7RFZ5_9BACT|nr:MAG: hypothetical protein COY66_06605 [Candidatus Kerfeldbacteria bacterium CG_4_10_14_0_8_um_filter_42_10]
MTLSIIILNYKAEGLTRYCLKNIISSDPKLEYELIVVDNASPSGGIGKLQEEFPSVKFIQLSENKGFSAGNNAGIKVARGDYVMLMNPDVVIVPNSLERLVSYLEKNPQVGIAGPKLLNANGTVQNSCLRFPDWKMPFFRRSPLGKIKLGEKYLKHYLMLDFDHNHNCPVEWLFGACLIFRKEAIDVVGLLDEGYFLYIADTDWCRMFWEKGMEVHYIADVSLVHYHHRESASSPGLGGIFSYVTRIHIKDFNHYQKKFRGKPIPFHKK